MKQAEKVEKRLVNMTVLEETLGGMMHVINQCDKVLTGKKKDKAKGIPAQDLKNLMLAVINDIRIALMIDPDELKAEEKLEEEPS